ncbi:unnamed protein product [Macrosiphum euphorbiae]|uniref:Uncharacterized protein n=1 Tax=Macrosiphum euphorbiae TaxID=13131 RepID=A0AAV0XVX2_9HEMI|nr:unnamed protein product [Macrosiphum euphorbiae]
MRWWARWHVRRDARGRPRIQVVVDRCALYDVTDYGWLCVGAVGGFSVEHIGLGWLLSTINCELFLANYQSIPNRAVITITLTVTMFLALNIYPVLVDEGGIMYRNYQIFVSVWPQVHSHLLPVNEGTRSS